jgi:hypothetical protein
MNAKSGKIKRFWTNDRKAESFKKAIERFIRTVEMVNNDVAYLVECNNDFLSRLKEKLCSDSKVV